MQTEAIEVEHGKFAIEVIGLEVEEEELEDCDILSSIQKWKI